MLRSGLIIAWWISLAIAGVSLAYLLFNFGHVEPEVTSHNRVLEVAVVAAISSLVAGVLQWVGLPAKEAEPHKGKGRKHATK